LKNLSSVLAVVRILAEAFSAKKSELVSRRFSNFSVKYALILEPKACPTNQGMNNSGDQDGEIITSH
jgi:hypothetical protein